MKRLSWEYIVLLIFDGLLYSDLTGVCGRWFRRIEITETKGI